MRYQGMIPMHQDFKCLFVTRKDLPYQEAIRNLCGLGRSAFPALHDS